MSIFFKLFAILLVTTGLAIASEDSAEVVLTLRFENRTQEPVEFTLEDLNAFGEDQFSTTTIWTTGPQTFSGVSLKSFLNSLGIENGTILASAINDYTVEIPVSDAVIDGPMIAYRLNGEEMSIRDKGPLWIVYPYDSKSEYQAEVIYSRSIWQLDRIAIVD
ncbi:hypothetical protein SAMN05444003_3074 [Cognatiyoonia sediminum]|uniref:Oxidoreductase molybdopterin-binding domain-containing protein n=1 Tax=Cognatiyoonia sediminum TaxID=1508389 RepID=A0A1M5SS44_9RHOB|nr:molybdopterin-dependent oxidoreductase [Cognatiyoonia sediminum]SHH41349.1 hypothetical protein SAMN05444003_3074 [Cognatiyoonia sediminum]